MPGCPKSVLSEGVVCCPKVRYFYSFHTDRQPAEIDGSKKVHGVEGPERAQDPIGFVHNRCANVTAFRNHNTQQQQPIPNS